MILPIMMRDPSLKQFGAPELQTMLETIAGEREAVRKINRPGQTPEFWNLVADKQKVRGERAIRGLTHPAPALVNLLEE